MSCEVSLHTWVGDEAACFFQLKASVWLRIADLRLELSCHPQMPVNMSDRLSFLCALSSFYIRVVSFEFSMMWQTQELDEHCL